MRLTIERNDLREWVEAMEPGGSLQAQIICQPLHRASQCILPHAIESDGQPAIEHDPYGAQKRGMVFYAIETCHVWRCGRPLHGRIQGFAFHAPRQPEGIRTNLRKRFQGIPAACGDNPGHSQQPPGLDPASQRALATIANLGNPSQFSPSDAHDNGYPQPLPRRNGPRGLAILPVKVR